jgi:hypothetical protein
MGWRNRLAASEERTKLSAVGGSSKINGGISLAPIPSHQTLMSIVGPIQRRFVAIPASFFSRVGEIRLQHKDVWDSFLGGSLFWNTYDVLVCLLFQCVVRLAHFFVDGRRKMHGMAENQFFFGKMEMKFAHFT